MAAQSARPRRAFRLALVRVASVLAVVSLAFFASAAGASAAVPAVAVAAVPSTDPVIPGPSIGANAKQYMLNVTGKVLGKAMPTGWKREQIAMNNRFNASWELMGRQTGIPSGVPAGQLITDGYMTNPQTASDYALRKAQMDLQGGTNGKPFKAPATAAAKFVKVVGGAATAYMGFSLGTMIGNAVPSEWLGVSDKTGLVCSNTGDDLIGGVLRDLSGSDCKAWGMDPTYAVNQDAPSTYSWSNVCNNLTSQTCMTVNSFQAYRYTSSVHGSGALYCLQITGPVTNLAYNRAATGNLQANNAVTGVSDPFSVSTSSGSIQCPAGSKQFVDTAYTSNGYAFRTTAVYPAYPDQLNPIDGIQLQNSSGSWGALSTRTQTLGDPDRTLQCSVLGSDGQTYTATSAPYKESTGNVAPPPCPALPAGVTAQNIAIDQKADPAKGVPAANLMTQPTTDEYKAWATSYPECATGACKLDLINKATGLSCFDSDETCKDWFSSPTRLTDYQCRYGIHDVDQSECNVYSGVFKKERLAVGAPYSDPLTGEWSGGQSAPAPDKQAMAQPIQSPLVTRGCDGMNVTGFDPVGFVMRPIQCAMEWAFVPRPLVVAAEVNKSSTAWSGTAPGKLGAVVGTWNVAPVISGCNGIPFTMFHKTVNFADACPGSALAGTAAVSSNITGVIFVIGGALAIVSIVASVIGYRGISKGGDD